MVLSPSSRPWAYFCHILLHFAKDCYLTIRAWIDLPTVMFHDYTFTIHLFGLLRLLWRILYQSRVIRLAFRTPYGFTQFMNQRVWFNTPLTAWCLTVQLCAESLHCRLPKIMQRLKSLHLVSQNLNEGRRLNVIKFFLLSQSGERGVRCILDTGWPQAGELIQVGQYEAFDTR